MNNNKIVALVIWNAVMLFVGLCAHFSGWEIAILFSGAWFGLLSWEGFGIRKWFL